MSSFNCLHVDSSKNYLLFPEDEYSCKRSTICQKNGFISEFETFTNAQSKCTALNDTLWNGDWDGIKHLNLKTNHSFWTNLVRLNLTHFISNEKLVQVKGKNLLSYLNWVDHIGLSKKFPKWRFVEAMARQILNLEWLQH